MDSKQNLLLSRYAVGADRTDARHYKTGKLKYHKYSKSSKRLDFDKYPKSIWTLLDTKPFFKRFIDLPEDDREIYTAAIERESQIELYRKEQPVFLKNRIGIVMMGSVEVRLHNNYNNLLRPQVLKKAIEGDVLGFHEGDEGQTASPLSWIMSKQDDTEVIFLPKGVFQ